MCKPLFAAALTTVLMFGSSHAGLAQGSFRSTPAGMVTVADGGPGSAVGDGPAGLLWISAGVVGTALVVDVLSGGMLSGPLFAMAGESAGLAGVLLGRGAAAPAARGALRGAVREAARGAAARAIPPAAAGTGSAAAAAGAAEAAAVAGSESAVVAGEVPLIGARIHTGGAVTTVRVYGSEVPEPISLRMVNGEPMPCMRFTVCGKMVERPYGLGPGSGGGPGPGFGEGPGGGGHLWLAEPVRPMSKVFKGGTGEVVP